jgi:hypothetical protein
MPNESFTFNNIDHDDNQKRLDLLKSQLEIAKDKNPDCASGGCGGLCGTPLCVKKVQGAINKIQKINRNTEE